MKSLITFLGFSTFLLAAALLVWLPFSLCHKPRFRPGATWIDYRNEEGVWEIFPPLTPEEKAKLDETMKRVKRRRETGKWEGLPP